MIIEPIKQIYADNAYKRKQAGIDPFIIINGNCAVNILFEYYQQLLKDGLTPIEDLPVERKRFYWMQAKKYHQGARAETAARSIYVLDLLSED